MRSFGSWTHAVGIEEAFKGDVKVAGQPEGHFPSRDAMATQVLREGVLGQTEIGRDVALRLGPGLGVYELAEAIESCSTLLRTCFHTVRIRPRFTTCQQLFHVV